LAIWHPLKLSCILRNLPTRLLNTAARLLVGTVKHDHIKHVLLHRLVWLPVPQSVQFKLCLLTFKALHGLAPTYLADASQLHQLEADRGCVPPPTATVTWSLVQRPATLVLCHSP